MQCKLSKNKGEDFMLKSIRKFFSMILPICMLVTTAPCIISSAINEEFTFTIWDNVALLVDESANKVYFYEPASAMFGEGNNSLIATLSSVSNNVTFKENTVGADSPSFTATSSDSDNFTLKLKVTDDAKKQGWMGAMDPLVRGDWSENPIYGSEKSCDVTKGDVNNKFGILLTKGKYIEIEKPSGDFDKNEVNSTISVNYKGEDLHFTKENGYTLAVPGEDAAGDVTGGGIKVTVEDEAPFTCVGSNYEKTGEIGVSSPNTDSYLLSGTGTCKLRFKDNRKGVWLAGNDGSECGYVEVSTYANEKDWKNGTVVKEKSGKVVGEGYYYVNTDPAADQSEIVHAKFVPNDGYMTDDRDVTLGDDAFEKLGDGEKNDNEEHYLTYNSKYAKKIENFGKYFDEKIPEGKVSSDTNLKTVKVEKTPSGKIYSAKFNNTTNGDKVAMDKWVKYTIGKNYSTQELGTYEVTVSEIFDETSGSFKVEETEEFVTITLTLNSEAKEKLKKLMNEGGTIKVARNHNGEITFLPDKDVEVDLEKGTITFRAKKFSTYGFYVVSKKDENDVIANNVVSAKNLKTGEDASYLTFLGVLLVTGGWLFILSKRKNKILK